MAKNRRKQNSKTEYLLEADGKQYGVYKDEETARQIAYSLMKFGKYCVIRRGDEKIWES